MKKLRERLSNKKGFTLVELIVVIVIILILAAVLIPNVMRYIESARKSAFQTEASGYLTEITGYEAEYYAQTAKDATNTNITSSADRIGGTNRPLTGHKDASDVSVVPGDDDGEVYKNVSSSYKISVKVKSGAVTAFAYTDGKYYVSWSQSKGWTNVETDPENLAFKSET